MQLASWVGVGVGGPLKAPPHLGSCKPKGRAGHGCVPGWAGNGNRVNEEEDEDEVTSHDASNKVLGGAYCVCPVARWHTTDRGAIGGCSAATSPTAHVDDGVEIGGCEWGLHVIPWACNIATARVTSVAPTLQAGAPLVHIRKDPADPRDPLKSSHPSLDWWRARSSRLVLVASALHSEKPRWQELILRHSSQS